MKVYINRRPRIGPYGGGNMFIKAYHELARTPGRIDLLVDDRMVNVKPDVILAVGLENEHPDIGIEQAIMYKMYVNPDCKIVLRVNENDARKGTNHMDSMLLKVSEHVDATVFVSEWLRAYFMEKGWACTNNTVIYNGVDNELFKPQPKMINGKLNIVAHHWSDNRMKGADVYEALDRFVGQNVDRFTFTYIGRHQCDFKHTQVIKPLSGKRLGEELGKYDVYVSASRFDPGPNHVLEALSCGLPTYVHKDGGGCVEFAGENAVYEDFSRLETILHEHLTGRSPSLSAVNTFTPHTWKECVQKYNDFLEATWQTQTTQ